MLPVPPLPLFVAHNLPAMEFSSEHVSHKRGEKSSWPPERFALEARGVADKNSAGAASLHRYEDHLCLSAV